MSAERAASNLVNFRKTLKMLEAEKSVGDIVEYLEVAHLFERKTYHEIAKQLNELSAGGFIFHDSTIYRWRNRFNLTQFPKSTRAEMTWNDSGIKTRRMEGIKAYWLKIRTDPNAQDERTKRISQSIAKNRLGEAKEVLGKNPERKLRALYTGEKLSLEEIARCLTIPVSKLRKWLKDFGINIRQGGIGTRHAAHIKEGKKAIFDQAFKKGLLGQLRKKDRSILRDRLLKNPPLTLDEVGKKHGLTRERIRQIENRALSQLEHLLKSEPVDRRKFEFEVLNLSNRTSNSLVREAAYQRYILGQSSWGRLEDLYRMDDHSILQIQGLGKKGVSELRQKLEAFRRQSLQDE